MTDSVLYNEIIGRLELKNKRENLLLALSGAALTILYIVSCCFIFTIAESVFHFNSAFRTIIFFIIIISALSLIAFLIILPLLKYFKFFRRTDYYRTASEIGTYFPVIKDELLNAMQLVSGGTNLYYSTALIDASFRRVYEKSKGLHFEKVVSFKPVGNLLKYSIAAVIVMLVFINFIPGMQAASSRLYNFNKEFTPPPEFILNVYPGNFNAAKGTNINIRVTVSGKVPGAIFVALRPEDQTNFVMERMIADSSGIFEYNINSIRSTTDYYAYSGDNKSNEYRIEVSDKPLIKNFKVSVKSPSYSRIPEVEQTDNGNISALRGSIVNIHLSSNKELYKAHLNFGDTANEILDVQYSSASGKFNVRNDNTYRIILTDMTGANNESPVIYTITALQDDYPAIEVTEPAEDVDLANDNRLNLGMKITDDFGFSGLLLKYRLSESRYEIVQENYSVVELGISPKEKEAEIDYIWNLSSMNLGTDDVVSYYIEVFDNDVISGPKSSRSPEYKVRVPSLDEILAEADKKQNKVQDDLEKTLKEAEDLKNTLNKIDNDLKQDKKELSWEEKEKIENALNKFEELQDKLKNSGNEMNKMQEDLQKNNLLSKETLEKYLELQKLFEELSGEEFKKAMDRMKDMLDKMDRKSVRDEFENLKVNEESFKKSIERTINLLKRVRIEQKLDELVKRAEEINKNLDDLMKENDSQNSLQKQGDVSEQMKNIPESMEQIQKEMEGMKDMPREDLEKIADEFEKQKNDELSENASENIRQNQMQQARQNQSMLSKNMKNFSSQVQQLQQQMMQANQMQTFSDMMKILENLITLSKQQEELRKENENHQEMPAGKDAERQANLQRSLDNLIKQLGDLSQKTFAVTPEMGKALGDAKREMMKSMQAIQSRNGSYAANLQGDAMKSLNEAASLMQSSMESMMQGGGQGGMSLMQQLGQMAQQQMGINNLTQKLMQGNQGQLSPSEQAELRRIQQQQELIRKSLEELNREAKQTGESKKIPANLENIVKQMEEIISDMNTQRLDDKLVQKQERILSRLLDAQKSLNERDFEKQRESAAGENVVRKSPTGLDFGSRKEKEILRDELNRAVNEGYKRDYENLIKSYFEELSRENNKQKSGTD